MKHFPSEFLRMNPSTVSMAKSQWEQKMRTSFYIDKSYISGIFEH